MKDEYDLMVVGTGVAGNKVAEKCARYGWKVAISDNREMGGTCALRGCNPKKVLTTAASVVDQVRRMEGSGLSQGTGIIWEDLMRFKRGFTDHIPGDIERNYQELGVDVFHDEARFSNPSSVEVGNETINAKKFMVATGSKPRALGVRGEELMMTSDDFLELERLPPRILFVGGGYISFEFAQTAAIAGSEVTVVTHGPRVLREFDQGMSERIIEIFQELGIKVFIEAPPRAMERSEEGIMVDVGISSPLEVDLVVHGAGRDPNVHGIGLDAANVAYDNGGIIVNKQMQSVSNPDVYAAGDVIPNNMSLTPVADMEAFVVGENLVRKRGLEVDYKGIPTVVFTSPPIASVGMNEEECVAHGVKYRVKSGDMTRTNSSRRAMVRHSGFKVLIEEETNRILGAHIMGNKADEVINIFGLAMRQGITARELKSMPFAFPTDVYDSRYMV